MYGVIHQLLLSLKVGTKTKDTASAILPHRTVGMDAGHKAVCARVSHTVEIKTN